MSESNPKRGRGAWFAPKYPGNGKCPFTGFLCGFVFGALGVGLFLRSIADGLAVLVIALSCAFFLDLPSTLAIWLLSAGWCAARVVWDTHRCEQALFCTEATPALHPHPSTRRHNAHVDRAVQS